MTKSSFTFSRRSCGLLLHPTSLPGHLGSGDLGTAAYRFADFLAAAGQTWWQMLPVNPPGDPPGNSPYSSTSAFAGCPFLISLEMLADEGLLTKADLKAIGDLDGDAVAQLTSGFAFRYQRLRKAFAIFDRTSRRNKPFARFCKSQKNWLDDWSLYAALRDAHGGKAWFDWPGPLRMRDPQALREARKKLASEMRFQQFLQFKFDQQWTALREYCHVRGVGLIGDIPIFVAHDSADVWAHRDLFLLDAAGNPQAFSGYPPDAFNKLGQSWGHPQYRWEAHRKDKFAWWVTRFRQTLRLFDGARIDHFLGFHRTWHIPAGAKNARKGKWVLSPGTELFDTVTRAFPGAQIIAEDLGKLTKEASALRDRFDFPGMRIMQFGFGEGGSYHLPHRFPRRCVAYTGTHDNDTIVGWFEDLRKNRKRIPELRKLLKYVDDATEINWALMRVALASCADTIIFPVQDVLGLDNSARMNVPGTVDDNWVWRLRAGELREEQALRLRELVELYDRLPSVKWMRRAHKEKTIHSIRSLQSL